MHFHARLHVSVNCCGLFSNSTVGQYDLCGSCISILKTLFLRYQVAPVVASCAVRLSSSSNEQRFHQRGFSPSWTRALAGILAGTGVVLAYGLHHHKVRKICLFLFCCGKFSAIYFCTLAKLCQLNTFFTARRREILKSHTTSSRKHQLFKVQMQLFQVCQLLMQ